MEKASESNPNPSVHIPLLWGTDTLPFTSFDLRADNCLRFLCWHTEILQEL